MLIVTRSHYRAGAAPTLGDLLTPLGAEASALACALMALPFLSPVSLGPISTPVSIVIAILGWRLLRADPRTPLPERLLRLPIPWTVHRAMCSVLRHVHRIMYRISRPRMPCLVAGRRGRTVCAAGLVTGALLLAVPVPLLPLTNTFPAIGILLVALGWLERDGVLTLLGIVAFVLSAAIFAALGLAIVTVGWDLVEALVHSLILL